MQALGYDITDFMPCEISGNVGIDVHHIVSRENRIENLMLLTRELHQDLGEIKSKMHYLLTKHMEFLEINGVKFEYAWFKKHLEKYEVYKND